MKKRTYLHSRPWPGVMACGFSLFGGLSSASAAVIAQTFAVPLAPNTLNWGPDVKAGLEYQKRFYPMQWRIAPLAVDLDSNGTTDLTFTGTVGSTINTMQVSLIGRNEAWISLQISDGNLMGGYAHAFKSGSPIGPALTPQYPGDGWFNDADLPRQPELTVGEQGRPLGGAFLPDIPFQQKYLGVRFERDGAMHYGWVGISGYAYIGQEIYIHAWAYESEPDTAIIVGQIPEPGAGLLAAISGLLVGLRRKRKPDA